MLSQVTSERENQTLAETLPIRRAENVRENEESVCASQKSKGETFPEIQKVNKLNKLGKVNVDVTREFSEKIGESIIERIQRDNKEIREISEENREINKAAAQKDRKRKSEPTKFASVSIGIKSIGNTEENKENQDPCAVVADTSTKLAITSDSSSSAFVASDSSSIGTSVLRLRNSLDRQFQASSALVGPIPNQTKVNPSLVQEEKPLRTCPLSAAVGAPVELIEWTSVFRFQPCHLEVDCNLIIHLTIVIAQTIEYLVATRNPQFITLEAEFGLPVAFHPNFISKAVIREFLNHVVERETQSLTSQIEVVIGFDSDEDFVPFEAKTYTHFRI
jgi:hypothetical protein